MLRNNAKKDVIFMIKNVLENVEDESLNKRLLLTCRR